MVSESLFSFAQKNIFFVLILVLVEDGLREKKQNHEQSGIEAVLILVLVEDGLRVVIFLCTKKYLFCLNPCSCGGWSQSIEQMALRARLSRLNPCSCGGWSQSALMDFCFLKIKS